MPGRTRRGHGCQHVVGQLGGADPEEGGGEERQQHQQGRHGAVEEDRRHLRDGLAELAGVAEVRGRGLMVGVTLADGLDAPAIAGNALDAGLVINVPGPGMLRLLPPLVIGADEVDRGLALLGEVLCTQR